MPTTGSALNERENLGRSHLRLVRGQLERRRQDAAWDVSSMKGNAIVCRSPHIAEWLAEHGFYVVDGVD